MQIGISYTTKHYRVKARLKEKPRARVMVKQNDFHGVDGFSC